MAQQQSDKSFVASVARLKDPEGVAASPRQLQELQDKISAYISGWR